MVAFLYYSHKLDSLYGAALRRGYVCEIKFFHASNQHVPRSSADQWLTHYENGRKLSVNINVNKSSAVAELGDRGHNRHGSYSGHGPKIGLSGCALFSGGS